MMLRKNVCTRCTEIVRTLAVNTREISTDLTVIPTNTVPQVQASEKGSSEHTTNICLSLQSEDKEVCPHRENEGQCMLHCHQTAQILDWTRDWTNPSFS